MGVIGRIKKKVKETIGKAKHAVGTGIKKITEARKSPIGRKIEKTAFGTDIEGENIMGRDPETGEKRELVSGVVPFSPAGGGAAGVAKHLSDRGGVGAGMGQVTKTAKTAKGIIKVAGKTVNKQTVRTISKMFKVKPKAVTHMIERRLLATEVSKVVNKMSAADLALKTGKSLLKYGSVVAGADVMFQWYALDNVITGQKFFLGDVEKRVNDGTLKPDQAREALDSSAETRQVAIDKIKLSNSINPLLWAFRKLILTGVEADNAALDLKVLGIENAMAAREEEDARLAAGGEPELTSQEQFEANQASIKESQDERDAKADQRDQDFQDRQAERDEELAVRQAERDMADQEKTLFFEALSKRNAGQPLTDEEKQLLLDRGIDPERLVQQGGGLGFGLFR